MQFCIFVAFCVWALVTWFASFVVRKYKSELTSALVGGVFVLAAGLAPLYIPLFLGIQDGCITYTCSTDDNMSRALVTFVIITWGAIGANLLSAYISYKQE